MEPILSDEFVYKIRALKENEAFQYLMGIVARWKEQTINDMMNEADFEKVKEVRAEFKAYGRLLNLPDRIIEDLSKNTGMSSSEFDPYRQD